MEGMVVSGGGARVSDAKYVVLVKKPITFVDEGY